MDSENLLTIHESPMSIVLNNPYLLDLIFEHFGAYGQLFHPLAGNLNPYLAITVCKAFSTPALKALWRTLGSLTPLLRLLSIFVESDGGNYSLQGVANSTDWARFDTYAKRVRYVNLEYPDTVIPKYVYLRLAQLHTSPLLPNLLDFSCDATNLLGYGIFTFLSPSLQVIFLLGIRTSHNDMIGAFLSALVDEAPNLRYLTLHGKLSKTSLSFVGRLEALQSLSIGDLKLPVFLGVAKQIWSIEPLQTLRITWENIIPSLSSDNLLTPGLKGLKEITTRNGSLHLITQLMASIQSNTMEMIEIRDISSESGYGEEHIDINKSRHLLQQLFAAWDHWRYTLRCVTISYSPDRNGDSIDIFMPLSAHPNLTHLDLSHFGDLRSFSDTDTYKLAKNWPLMEYLCFPSVWPNREPTIKALVDIARCCPRLWFLQIPISVKLPPLHSTPFLKHGLQSLTVSNGVENTNLVARHLDRLFPALDSVSARHSDREMWVQVESMLKMFQDMRREAWGRSLRGL